MHKININPWICTKSYSLNKDADILQFSASSSISCSISFIHDVKSGMYYVLKGRISDLWNIIHSSQDINEIYEYAIKNNLLKELEEFLYELKIKDIIKISGIKDDIHLTSFKYLTFSIQNTNPNFGYFLGEKLRFTLKNNLIDTLTLELSYKCNLKCRHCYNQKDKNDVEITFETAKKIIDDACNEGVEIINLTGGECTICKDFLPIAKYIKKRFLSLNILTNAVFLYDNQKLLNELINLYPAVIQISLYSMNPEIHDSITGVKGSHFKTINVIKKLRENNINVSIACLSFALNKGEYNKVREFAEKIKADFSTRCFFVENPDNNNVHLKLGKDDIQKFYKDTFDIKNIRSAFIKDDNIVCCAGISRLCIAPNLDIKPCVSFPAIFGNYNNTSVAKLKETIIPKFKQSFIRKNLKDCFKHDYCKYCYFCRNYADFKSDYMKKSNSLCEDAKAYYNAYLHHTSL